MNKVEHLYDRLKEYSASDYYPYHMPGHKRLLCGNIPSEIIGLDITEIDGFDNLHQPEGILQSLQEKAAMLYGAEESFYLVNGSTCGILSAISAAVPMGARILMARNCHKSAYHAIYLRNLTVSYLYPPLMEEYDIHDAITPKQVEEALAEEPDIRAVLVVSPTYEGRIADIEQIAKIVHARGIPLIVDEAHGAHLGWKHSIGRNSCQAGADLVIHSVHKTLPAMTQTALLHVNGNLIDRNKLRRFLHIYQTSSPSYVLMASIDNAMDIMEKDGHRLLTAFQANFGKMLERLSVCKCLKFLPQKNVKQDIGKLVISVKGLSLSGQRLYDMLLEKYHLQLEMAAESYCLAMFTVSDKEEAYARMTDALLDVDSMLVNEMSKPDNAVIKNSSIIRGNRCDSIPLSVAWDMTGESVLLQESVGRYVGEFINLYPPGVPLLVPGEIMTEEMYEAIISYLEQQLNVQGVELQKDAYMIKVLKL